MDLRKELNIKNTEIERRSVLSLKNLLGRNVKEERKEKVFENIFGEDIFNCSYSEIISRMLKINGFEGLVSAEEDCLCKREDLSGKKYEGMKDLFQRKRRKCALDCFPCNFG